MRRKDGTYTGYRDQEKRRTYLRNWQRRYYARVGKAKRDTLLQEDAEYAERHREHSRASYQRQRLNTIMGQMGLTDGGTIDDVL